MQHRVSGVAVTVEIASVRLADYNRRESLAVSALRSASPTAAAPIELIVRKATSRAACVLYVVISRLVPSSARVGSRPKMHAFQFPYPARNLRDELRMLVVLGPRHEHVGQVPLHRSLNPQVSE
jgi:hypothetical protein